MFKSILKKLANINYQLWNAVIIFFNIQFLCFFLLGLLCDFEKEVIMFGLFYTFFLELFFSFIKRQYVSALVFVTLFSWGVVFN